jgi:hypothetical protein
MFKVTRYFVENGQGQARGPFRERVEAGAVAASSARRGLAARVYAVTGEPMFDLWNEPELVEAYGAGSSAPVSISNLRKTAEILSFNPRSRSS